MLRGAGTAIALAAWLLDPLTADAGVCGCLHATGQPRTQYARMTSNRDDAAPGLWTPTMEESFARLIERFDLGRAHAAIRDAVQPAIAVELTSEPSSAATASRFGGVPRLPRDFVWPTRGGRRLWFLLQINLEDIAALDVEHRLPPAGHCAVFYDVEEQPWGFDPKDIDGFRVAYFPPGTPLQPVATVFDRTLPEQGIQFSRCLTVPVTGSRAFDRLQARVQFSDVESDTYHAFAEVLRQIGREPGDVTTHQILGHAWNIQGDMQLEAQLVSAGLNCGDDTGFQDPRRPELEAGADAWRLLLQIDSDDEVGLMWGDAGMLYFWIRDADLQDRRFERAWMTLQCH